MILFCLRPIFEAISWNINFLLNIFWTNDNLTFNAKNGLFQWRPKLFERTKLFKCNTAQLRVREMTDTPQNIIKTVALLVPTLAAGFRWSRNVVVTPTSLRRLGPLRCFDSSSECRPSSEAFQFLEKKILIGHSWVAHFPGIGLSEHEFFAWTLLNSSIRIVVEGAMRRCLVLGCSCLNNTFQKFRDAYVAIELF